MFIHGKQNHFRSSSENRLLFFRRFYSVSSGNVKYYSFMWLTVLLAIRRKKTTNANRKIAVEIMAIVVNERGEPESYMLEITIILGKSAVRVRVMCAVLLFFHPLYQLW